jgi:hypothetical protein
MHSAALFVILTYHEQGIEEPKLRLQPRLLAAADDINSFSEEEVHEDL